MNSVIAQQHVFHDPIYAEEANQARYQGIRVKECEVNAKYYIQCTTWRDKKQVMFLHAHFVEASKDNTVRRHVREQSQRIEINGPTIQQDYAQ